jgi:tetratricopeptide (TPR) repeat protein
LLPQAQGCATLIEQWNLAFSEAARLLNQAGCYLHERGHYPEALLLVQRALAIREKVLGAEHPDTAQSLNNLAFLYKARGNYPEALPLYQRALAICEKALGPEHPDTKSVCNGYTDLLKHMKSA